MRHKDLDFAGWLFSDERMDVNLECVDGEHAVATKDSDGPNRLTVLTEKIVLKYQQVHSMHFLGFESDDVMFLLAVGVLSKPNIPAKCRCRGNPSGPMSLSKKSLMRWLASGSFRNSYLFADCGAS